MMIHIKIKIHDIIKFHIIFYHVISKTDLFVQ